MTKTNLTPLIEKIALECGLTCTPSVFPNMPQLCGFTDVNLEEFAERLIRECAKTAEEHYLAGGIIPATTILDKFGLKE